MALNPEEKPREFLIMVIAALHFAVSEIASPTEAFDQAEQFVAEAERRYGPIGDGS